MYLQIEHGFEWYFTDADFAGKIKEVYDPDYVDILEFSKEQIDKTIIFISELFEILIDLKFQHTN